MTGKGKTGGLSFRPYLAFILIPPLILMLFLSVFPFKRAIVSLVYPYQLDYAEGFLAVEAEQLASGQSIYQPVEEPPYLVGNYPPVYPLLQAPFFFLFGPSLLWGRLIVFLSTLGIMIMIGFIVWGNSRYIIMAILSPLLFWNTFALHEWIAYVRVDLPAICLGLAGLFMISLNDSRRNRMIALLLFSLSLYTKQIQFFAPLAACLYLIMKDWKSGLKFTGILAGIVLGIFIILTLLTRGEYFRHTVTYNANIFEWWQVLTWIRHVLRFHFFFVILFVMLLIFYTVGRFKNKKDINSFDLYFIYAVLGLISVLAIGKVGAASNYLLEFYVSAAIFAGLIIGEWIKSIKRNHKNGLLLFLFYLSVVLLFFHSVRLLTVQRMLFSRPNPEKVALEKGDRLLEIIKGVEGEVYSEQPVFNLLSGKEVSFQPFIMSELAKEGKWNQEPFLKKLSHAEYSLIVTGQDIQKEGFKWQYTEEMQQAIRQSYRSLYPEGSMWKRLLEHPAGGIPYYVYVPEEEK